MSRGLMPPPLDSRISALTNLQGGYNFSAISKSALAVTRTLMGEPPDRLQATAATQSAVDTVAKVRSVQSKYWRSIYPKGLSAECGKSRGVQLSVLPSRSRWRHLRRREAAWYVSILLTNWGFAPQELTWIIDIIRQWQAMDLYDKYKLTQLHIFRDTVSKSFDHQVLAT